MVMDAKNAEDSSIKNPLVWYMPDKGIFY